MFLSTLVGAFLVVAARAAPVLDGAKPLNSTIWTPDYVLQPDEVILYGEGRMEVVHESIFHGLLADQEISLEAPEVDESFLSFNSSDLSSDLEARDEVSCGRTLALVTTSTQTFIDWDVQMSPVVIGTGTNGLNVYVSSGYSVSNSVSVSAGLDLGEITSKLSAISTGIDYTRTWSTQTVIQVNGNVPNGFSGVMITKPIKNRKYGKTMTGCIGSQTQSGTFMADSFEQGSYAGVSWVSGAITMCVKKQFPLTRCTGSGKFI
ncbi:hypothetical protein ASPZODRAFT_125875 [Penicilliopsis zonata CBS 506.65]|uniref:Peptidase A1 domain-containing protein n=1 Tax=Penicilliopsis zonata CBS 506.65 TaxID=1073090 RepID=A0A1L9S4Z0_9EURO|nr:hypothetical protein ASPZODRAFT_125875 [Penicilliopsis zonata CBS 506.65]OJJ42221.1 hypothetical protein ASPZODRAFT_125875 [Penicilliopsis zonata CBS 506.65]